MTKYTNGQVRRRGPPIVLVAATLVKLLRYMGAATVVALIALMVACQAAVLPPAAAEDMAVEERTLFAAQAAGEWVWTPTSARPATVHVREVSNPVDRPEPAKSASLPTLTLRRSGGGSLTVSEGEWFAVVGARPPNSDWPERGLTAYAVTNPAGLDAGRMFFRYAQGDFSSDPWRWGACSTDAIAHADGGGPSVTNIMGETIGREHTLIRCAVQVPIGDDEHGRQSFTFQSLDREFVEADAEPRVTFKLKTSTDESDGSDIGLFIPVPAPPSPAAPVPANSADARYVEVQAFSSDPNAFQDGLGVFFSVKIDEEREGQLGEWYRVGSISMYQTGIGPSYLIGGTNFVYGCADVAPSLCRYRVPRKVPYYVEGTAATGYFVTDTNNVRPYTGAVIRRLRFTLMQPNVSSATGPIYVTPLDEGRIE